MGTNIFEKWGVPSYEVQLLKKYLGKDYNQQILYNELINHYEHHVDIQCEFYKGIETSFPDVHQHRELVHIPTFLWGYTTMSSIGERITDMKFSVRDGYKLRTALMLAGYSYKEALYTESYCCVYDINSLFWGDITDMFNSILARMYRPTKYGLEELILMLRNTGLSSYSNRVIACYLHGKEI